MQVKITTIISVLMIIGGMTTLINNWLKADQKRQLIIKIREIYTTLNQSDPVAVIQAPIRGIAYFYKMIFGENILSWKSIKRLSLFSILILITSLAVAGWIIDIPFAIKQPPWKEYESFASAYSDQIQKNIQSSSPNSNYGKLSAEEKESLKTKAIEINKPIWKWLYSIILIIIVVLMNAFFDVTSFLITRKILNELLTTEQPLLILGALCLDTFLAVFIGGFTILFLTASTNLLVLMFIILGIMMPTSVFSVVPIIWKAIFTFAWTLSPPWVRVTAFSTMLPTIILLVMCLITLITFPIRNHIHKIICSFLDRLATHEQGPIVFISICSAALVSILGGTVTLFQQLW
jgi:hypothetical protein